MDFRPRHLTVALVALAALALPGAAMASPAAVVRDCAEDGSLQGSYSDEDKRAALDRLPADLDEYSDCRAVISAAVGSDDGPSASASSSGPGQGDATAGAGTATRGATRTAKRRGTAPRRADRAADDAGEARPMRWLRKPERTFDSVAVDTQRPGAVRAANSAGDMPLPLIVGLVALGALWLAIGVLLLWRPPAVDGAIRRLTSGRFGR